MASNRQNSYIGNFLKILLVHEKFLVTDCGRMAFETLARELYEATTKEMNGRNSREVAGELEKKFQVIGELKREVGDDMKKVMLAKTEEELRGAANVLKKFDVKNVKKPDNVGGDAKLSTQGSAEVDLLKHSGEDGLPDKRKLESVEIHERTHERQKKPDADSVHIGDREVTSTAFIEAGAIIAQTDAIRESVGWISDTYRSDYYENMLALLPDRRRLKELSVRGQFQQFAREANARARETDFTMAG